MVTVDYEEVIYEVEDGVATLTMYRPDKLNTVTDRMTEEIHLVLDAVEADDSVRVLIVTGAGRAFSAGRDLTAPRLPAPVGGLSRREGTGSITRHLWDFPKPVIAAINGAAAGFGISFCLPMDIRIASTEARFGMTYSRRGSIPESGVSWFLPRVVGVEQALAWMYSGRIFGAQEALEGGLVSEVVEPDALLDRCMEIGREIATYTAPVAVALIRQLVWKGITNPDLYEHQRHESAMGQGLRGTPDQQEGSASFLEQRDPHFVGRVSTDLPAAYPWWPPRAAEN